MKRVVRGGHGRRKGNGRVKEGRDLHASCSCPGCRRLSLFMWARRSCLWKSRRDDDNDSVFVRGDAAEGRCRMPERERRRPAYPPAEAPTAATAASHFRGPSRRNHPPSGHSSHSIAVEIAPASVCSPPMSLSGLRAQSSGATARPRSAATEHSPAPGCMADPFVPVRKWAATWPSGVEYYHRSLRWQAVPHSYF